jgi:phenylpyruvate tautomerase PptA (4-oxalocrotonate tautomerase family)
VSDVVETVADATQDVVDVVVENVDEQTDAIQSKEEE